MESREWSILLFTIISYHYNLFHLLIYPPFLMGERVSIMGEGWDTGRIGGGRINYCMERNIGKKWWMGMECQKRERDGVSEGGGVFKGWALKV